LFFLFLFQIRVVLIAAMNRDLLPLEVWAVLILLVSFSDAVVRLLVDEHHYPSVSGTYHNHISDPHSEARDLDFLMLVLLNLQGLTRCENSHWNHRFLFFARLKAFVHFHFVALDCRLGVLVYRRDFVTHSFPDIDMAIFTTTYDEFLVFRQRRGYL